MSDTIVKIVVCSGTACYVMGGSELLLLDDHIPGKWKARIQIEGSPCLGYCKDKKHGKAPFAMVDGTLLSQATVPEVLRLVAERLGEN